MKCEFFLLDLNESEWDGRPCIRFWGVDEQNRRNLIIATQIMPYFYFLPKDAGGLDPIRGRLVADKKKFDKILEISIERRKLLGKDCDVLKITCSQQDAVSTYAKGVPKAMGGGASFEDLRLSVRYVTDLMLTTCGWNQCEVDPIKLDGVVADASYVATRAPRSLVDRAQPKLRLLAFTILTAARKGSAKPEQDPVRAIAVATDSGKTALFTSLGDEDSETLNSFMAYLRDFDPDVVVGFESNRNDWPYLMERCKLSKKKLAVGRDFSEPHSSVFGHKSVTGRANLDLFDVASSIPQVKVRNLENVARYFRLSSAERIRTIDEWDRYGLWTSESGKQQLLQNTLAASRVCLELAQATIDYPIQLSAITGLPLDQVMAAAVGFRVDSYFVRQAHQICELVPTKNEQPSFTYRGAIVLEPETGVHENVAVLDFASMYPSLMEKYNLSPDTLVKLGEQLPDDSVYVIPEVGHRFRKEPPGFFTVVLKSLIEQRAYVKKQIENLPAGSTTFRVLKERERALKVITNACYGYAGWAGARWYFREVAESATALGRDTITKAIEKAKSLGLNIIYGDTDSIFVTNEKAKIEKLLKWVDEELELEVKVEHEYTRVLFTEAMKRYAGLREDGTLDIVGLEVVRGDWSDVARQVQEKVLECILKDRSTEKAIESVRETIRWLSKGEVPIADLAIRKTLTKPIEDYAVRVPHVEVAKMLVKEGWRLSLGDKVAYVIAKGPGKLFQKAKPYNQVKPDDVDIEYYVENQVKPAAMRILERFAVDEKQLVA